jgi:O-antigen ligase
MPFKLWGAIFPLTLVAFEAVGVRYWNIVFNDTTRWFLVAILLLAVLLRGQIILAFRGTRGVFIGAYLLWCLCTTMWSEEPQLSLMKSVALMINVTALFGAGYAWTLYSDRSAPFGFLLPVVILALFAGLFDPSAASFQAGTITIYQGLSGNPNYLGSIVAMSFPYAFWQVYRARSGTLSRFLYLTIFLALAVLLWRSGSRASTLCVLSMLTMLIVALSPKKRFTVICLIGVLSLGAAIALPALQISLYERFIVKGNVNEDGSVLYTRQEVWSESYELAKQGGLIGGGYGVTIGDTGGFAGGLTSVGYGREKGNSQLAVWEETGIVGLTLYSLLLFAILLELGSGFAKTRNPNVKVELGLLLGTIIGFTLHSVFEAWWVAPGGPEFAYFWSIVGAAYGSLQHASSAYPYGRPAVHPVESGRATRATNAML